MRAPASSSRFRTRALRSVGGGGRRRRTVRDPRRHCGASRVRSGAWRTIDPFAPAALGPVSLRNRIIKAATFEGRTPKRVVTPELDRVPSPVRGRRRRHDDGRVLRGHACGHAPTAIRSCSTTPRSAPGCARSPTRCTPRARRSPPRSVTPVRSRTRWARSRPRVAPSRVFSPLGMRRHAVGDRRRHRDDRRAVRARRGRAARRGLRRDRGAHRARLPAERVPVAASSTSAPTSSAAVSRTGRASRSTVVRAVRAAAGRDVAVTAKINMADGVRGGFWLDESVEFARMLEADGSLDALDAHRRQLVREPDVPLPRRGADRGDGRDVPGRLKTGHQALRRDVLQGVPVRGGVLPAVRPAVPGRALDAARAARRHQPARHDHPGARRRLRVRADRPRAAPRARAARRDAEGPAARSRCASTATSACRRSTPARAACSSD